MKEGNTYKKNKSGGKFGANFSGLSIHKFAKGKSIDLKRIKREKEIERFKKHKALSKYARLCKSEGVVSDRVRIGPKDSNNDHTDKDVKKDKNQKPMTTYDKAMKVAQQKEKDKIQIEILKKNKEEEIKQAQKIRKEKVKLHMKRTRKGQPILHNQIHAILNKLQDDKKSKE